MNDFSFWGMMLRPWLFIIGFPCLIISPILAIVSIGVQCTEDKTKEPTCERNSRRYALPSLVLAVLGFTAYLIAYTVLSPHATFDDHRTAKLQVNTGMVFLGATCILVGAILSFVASEQPCVPQTDQNVTTCRRTDNAYAIATVVLSGAGLAFYTYAHSIRFFITRRQTYDEPLTPTQQDWRRNYTVDNNPYRLDH